MAQKTVSAQQDERTPDQGEIGTLNSVLSGGPQLPEIEVDAVVEPESAPEDDTVIIRVNEDVEDMTIHAGGQMYSFSFEVGHRYRVPVQVARELEAVGRIWH